MWKPLWVLVLIGGCWRGDVRETAPPAETSTTASTAPREDGAPCDQVAAHVRDVMAASDEGPVARRAEGYREVVVRRCAADGWSIELKRCLVGSPTLDATDGCQRLATAEQQRALADDVERMLGAN